MDNLPDETLKNIAAFYADKALQEGDPGTADLALGKRSIVTVCSIRACRHAARAIPPGPGQRSRRLPGGLRAERGLRGYAAEGLPAGERATDESYGQMMRGVARNLNDEEIAAVSAYVQGLR